MIGLFGAAMGQVPRLPEDPLVASVTNTAVAFVAMLVLLVISIAIFAWKIPGWIRSLNSDVNRDIGRKLSRLSDTVEHQIEELTKLSGDIRDLLGENRRLQVRVADIEVDLKDTMRRVHRVEGRLDERIVLEDRNHKTEIPRKGEL